MSHLLNVTKCVSLNALLNYTMKALLNSFFHFEVQCFPLKPSSTSEFTGMHIIGLCGWFIKRRWEDRLLIDGKFKVP